MKISMTVTLDVNADEWTAEYGCGRDDVREDVRSYFLSALQQCSPSIDGIVRSVEIKR